jgi:formyltetrahydrofolate deformylase
MTFILTLACKDTTGIVATVSGFLFEIGGFIIESDQFGDDTTGKFFMRAEFKCSMPLPEIKNKFSKIADRFSMNYNFFDKSTKPKILIAVSNASHCLSHLLHKYEIGSLNADIMGVVSNHNSLEQWAKRFNIDFFHLPIGNNKQEQEDTLYNLFLKLDCELLVLARYMQVLSDDICNKLSGKAINIHHSFLPGFKGAKPYHQAYDRGVKIIGATAHYITTDLDEGPIIEQEVIRVNHSYKPEDLKQTGEDIESSVLFRAIKWHLDRRVIVNNNKTVIF